MPSFNDLGHGLGYVPLWCKSNYSFLEGASHPEELITTAHGLGLPSLALTDRDGVHGLVRAHGKARELGLGLICGSEITLDEGPSVVVLVKNRTGYRHMCRLITLGRRRSVKGSSQVSLLELCQHSAGLIALWHGWSPLELEPSRQSVAADPNHLPRLLVLKEAFGRDFYLVLTRHLQMADRLHERTILQSARELSLPLVASTEVLYHHRQRRSLHDVVTCIRHGLTLDRAGRALRANAEHALLDAMVMRQRYDDQPQALVNTLEIAQACEFNLSQLRYRYPDELLPGGQSAIERLRACCEEGLAVRYAKSPPKEAINQMRLELELIQELDYAGYFLTMHDIVAYCISQNILCQGRGSAANSVVCFLLGVTAIDPIASGFLFERFLSRERAEPPDIDLDIEHEHREVVIQHVYEKYGRDRAAMVANVIRYRSRSALREVGKVLDLSESSIDRAARLADGYGNVEPEVLQQAGLRLDEPRHQLLLQLANDILDFPRHLSIHPGGFLLGHEPVCDLVPIENATMPARTVIQWDKDDVEALGLFKVDLLALGSLTHIHKAFQLIEAHHGKKIDLAGIPANDIATYDMICKADTIGVFQIESRAQMSMLPRLRPRTFYDLVVEISIVRPGPISGGMVNPYLKRRLGLEPIDFPHDCLRLVLERTLGIPLFQEQVMRLAMVAADYTPGEADQLRRDMASWRNSGRMQRHQERLIERMVKKGISIEFAERVFKQILGFGEYGFPESHAASFAKLAYATSWLKCHYPAEFTCSLLNSQPMGFYTPATIIHDAKRHGVVFAPVDVTISQWDCTIERPSDAASSSMVRMGLRMVKGFAAHAAATLVQTREQRAFTDIDDFTRRTAFDRKVLAKLAGAGALQALQEERRHALWEVQGALIRRDDRLPLPSSIAPPTLTSLSAQEDTEWDYLYAAHSTRNHPFVKLRAQLERQHCRSAAELEHAVNGEHLSCAGMVICRQRPPTANGVFFMTLEDETGLINVVVWKATFARYNTVLRTCDTLFLRGKVQRQEGVIHFIAEHVKPLELGEVTRAVPARNFH